MHIHTFYSNRNTSIFQAIEKHSIKMICPRLGFIQQFWEWCVSHQQHSISCSPSFLSMGKQPIWSCFMFQMFLEGQTESKGGCRDSGTSRKKNNSFSSSLFSVVVHLTWENKNLRHFKKPQDLHLYVSWVKLIIGFGLRNKFFPTGLAHRAYSF